MFDNMELKISDYFLIRTMDDADYIKNTPISAVLERCDNSSKDGILEWLWTGFGNTLKIEQSQRVSLIENQEAELEKFRPWIMLPMIELDTRLDPILNVDLFEAIKKDALILCKLQYQFLEALRKEKKQECYYEQKVFRKLRRNGFFLDLEIKQLNKTGCYQLPDYLFNLKCDILENPIRWCEYKGKKADYTIYSFGEIDECKNKEYSDLEDYFYEFITGQCVSMKLFLHNPNREELNFGEKAQIANRVGRIRGVYTKCYILDWLLSDNRNVRHFLYSEEQIVYQSLDRQIVSIINSFFGIVLNLFSEEQKEYVSKLKGIQNAVDKKIHQQGEKELLDASHDISDWRDEFSSLKDNVRYTIPSERHIKAQFFAELNKTVFLSILGQAKQQFPIIRYGSFDESILNNIVTKVK